MNMNINGNDVFFVLEITSRNDYDEMYNIDATKIVSTYDELYKLNNYIRLNPIAKYLIYQIWPVTTEWHSKGDMWLNVPHNL